MDYSVKEKKIIELLKKENLSLSHDFDHLYSVAKHASLLAKIYQGRREIVVVAALLHDLARNDYRYRGKQSAIKGAQLAEKLLIKAGYSEKEIKDVVRSVEEHDQPDLHSDLLEARILKDADFLDGFGARGILRSILYAGETGEGIKEIVERLGDKGRKRLEGLEFVESQRLGWQQYRLTELFLSELELIKNLDNFSYPGKFIVLEGISGSGKDTQAELLAEYIRSQGKEAGIINHPTAFFKKVWRLWREEVDDRLSELFLLLADRVRMTKEIILPALKKGEIVISTRSSLSSQVYQHVDEYPSPFHRFCFAFEPVADLLIYLDIDVEEALRRANERVKKGIEKDRGFFGKKQTEQKQRFKKMLRFYPNVVSINASGSKKVVASKIVTCVANKLSLR